MKTQHGRRNARRRGTVVVLAALLAVPLIGMVAFGVDIGYMALVRTELQRTADSSSIAGAMELLEHTTVNPAAPTGPPLQDSSTVPAEARTFASYNAAGTVSPSLLDADIVVGRMDNPTNLESQIVFSGTYNAVQVRVRRDDQANSPVTLFFCSGIRDDASAADRHRDRMV